MKKHEKPGAVLLAGAKSQSVAQILFKCARLWNEQAVQILRRRTDSDLRNVHTSLFPHIELEGTRLTDLAARMGVSKQAAGQLVTELEEMGFLERIPDPADGRARLIVFSQQGGRSILDGLSLLGEMEKGFAAKIGPRKMKQLHEILTTLLEELSRKQI